MFGLRVAQVLVFLFLAVSCNGGGQSPNLPAGQPPIACVTTTPPVVAGEIVGTAPMSVQFDVSCSSDPDGDLMVDGKISINFGDNVRINNEDFSGFAVITKPYSTPGEFQITYSIRDGSGNVTEGDPITVRVLP